MIDTGVVQCARIAWELWSRDLSNVIPKSGFGHHKKPSKKYFSKIWTWFGNISKDELLTLTELRKRSKTAQGHEKRKKVIPLAFKSEAQNWESGISPLCRLWEAISSSSDGVRSSCLAFWKALSVYFQKITKSRASDKKCKFWRAKHPKIRDFA